ncbi:cation-translocating P-type ATPase [Streptacidiphilus sp. P02-A3a]|uniref:cation-translocating P-type ATPase n=1 Tax=Streptacidiphilus sp. P02-A3a TaxID=2704468 RepID=UPI0015FDADF3|nr:cation-translocating P-type ATPase [Streptacidiphilus sp. P02-A3a]QMU70668.1 cation-translocating P-type ATPase [Streptacidiphilus sp. P02-A3a]
MVLRLLTRLPATALGLALAAPAVVGGRIVPQAGATVRLAAELAGAGARSTAQGASALSASAVRVGTVARNAVTPGLGYWRAGSRLHLPLRPGPDTARLDPRRVEAAAKRVAVDLARHPDVVAAYWDGGLARLVVRLAEGALSDEVVDRATELATGRGLTRPDEQVLERVHPGHPGGVRAGAIALACDSAGIAAAVTARSLRVKRSPRLVTAVVTLVREDSRVRAALRTRLGEAGADLLLAAANAVAHGIGQSPTALVLDAALRVGQLTESFARAAAFDTAHDAVCAPGRLSLAGSRAARPAPRSRPGQAYADQAVTTSLVGAAATLLFTRDVREAAEAVLAGSPKAARYGPAAFASVLGTALARDGVLVRDTERLRQLEVVDTVVLHPGALRSTRRTVLAVNTSTEEWEHDRLWQAVAAALGPSRPGAAEPDEPVVSLRPVPDEGVSETGLMIVSLRRPGSGGGGGDGGDGDGDGDTGDDGPEIGTALVGWEVDPLAESVLDAARRAGLYVVVLDDGALGDFAALADERVPADRPLAEVVRGLRRAGRVVLTVAHVPGDSGTVAAARGRRLPPESADLLAGLLCGDVAVSLTDERSAVVWGADVLPLGGLAGVWRLLTAVPAARAVGRRSRTLAEAGAALSGLLVVTRGARPDHLPFPAGMRLGPVNAAAAATLLLGWYAAARVGAQGAPRPRPRVPWHALQPREALSRLRAGRRAAPAVTTTVRRAAARTAGRAAGLPVFVPARLSLRLLGAVRAELDDPLTPVLVVGAVASALLGSTVDALLVTGALGVNATVGGVQRLRAERALSALVVSQRQTARRVAGAGAGPTDTVEARRLEPGEVIELRTGDVVPADARLLKVDGLEVDESSLTGESLPSAKQLEATPRAAVADRLCMVFEGTTVVAGQARAVVVGTGDETEAGRAAQLASRAGTAGGVQARLRELTNRVLPLTLAGGATVTGLSLLRGRPVRDAVRGGLAVAVAAVPEGLPLVATVAQLAAARRLGRRGILVRTPRTLEALGRMNTVCFDKTGTLTENHLRVVTVVTPRGDVRAVGAPEAAAVLRTAARACPPVADETGIHAHATDEAVLDAAEPEPGWIPADTLPFAASRGYASATGTDADGVHLLVVKGAPEVLLPNCPDAGSEAAAMAHELAGQGLRVLAVAVRRLPPEHAAEALRKPLESLELAGFVALADTPRPSSAPLVAALRRAGVRPVMLTGDHPQTARAVATALGWPADVTVVTGDQLAAEDRAGRARLLQGCGVVARVAPEQKLQVVESLRAGGQVVAMVGDGSNDAAAIRAADIGVGVAARGSAAARNAADLVITTGELTVLLDAVAEGRALWRSVADAVSILIGGNAGEIGFCVLGTLLSGSSPLSTRQLLLVNLLTDMFPAMAVAVTPRGGEPAASGTGDGEPLGSAPVDTEALGGPLTGQIRQRGVVTGLGAGTAWLIGTLTPGTRRRTSTMALCGVVGAQLTQTLLGRGRSPLVLATVFGSAAFLTALVQTPGVSHFFGCTPLGPVAWTGVAAAVGLAALGPWIVPPAERLLTAAGSRLRPVVRPVR